MTDAEEMLLEDAIRTAIKSELKVAHIKRMTVLGCVVFSVLGVFLGFCLWGMIYG